MRAALRQAAHQARERIERLAIRRSCVGCSRTQMKIGIENTANPSASSRKVAG